MATDLQNTANRANALLSTGPRTTAGKTRSSLNALKHGCTAQTVILPGEDAMHFFKFHQSYIKDLAPQGALEESLVQELAQTQWAITRIRAHETSLFALGHEKYAEEFKSCADPVIQAAFAGAMAFKNEGDTIKNLGLYLQRNNRTFHTTLKVLREIQATRQAKTDLDLQQALLCAFHQDEKIPFEPSEFGFHCSAQDLEPFLRRSASSMRRPKPLDTPPIQQTNAA
jgi:hypothetical protein